MHQSRTHFVVCSLLTDLLAAPACSVIREEDNRANVHLLKEAWAQHNDKHTNPVYSYDTCAPCHLRSGLWEIKVLRVVGVTCLRCWRACFLSKGVFLEPKQHLEDGIKQKAEMFCMDLHQIHLKCVRPRDLTPIIFFSEDDWSYFEPRTFQLK